MCVRDGRKAARLCHSQSWKLVGGHKEKFREDLDRGPNEIVRDPQPIADSGPNRARRREGETLGFGGRQRVAEREPRRSKKGASASRGADGDNNPGRTKLSANSM